ncbi:MAG: hypothetical protein GSR86_08135 [Desulfurococcales archaeon]|nr:hypothetical protein [Desulfurococcales archaeon]
MIRACGLDPAAGSGLNGYAILESTDCRDGVLIESGAMGSLYKVLERLKGCNVVAVDAPLTIPYRGFRGVERRFMKTYHVRLLPGGLKGMARLTSVGYSIRALMEEAGVAVIETHPGSVAKINSLEGAGDVFDAIVSSAVALAHICGAAQYVIDHDGLLAIARFSINRDKIELKR